MTGRAAHLYAWSQSARWREIARRQCHKMNAARRLKPKCGARRKYDGQPCQNVALENGRCKYHGGKVPKGRQWHVMQLPDKRSPKAVQRTERKLQDAHRKQKERNARLAAMTPEQLQAYERQKAARMPGSPEKRAQRRREAAENASFRARVGDRQTDNGEVRAFAEERARLERELAEIEGQLLDAPNIGVFG